MPETYAHTDAERMILLLLYAPYRPNDPSSKKDFYVHGRTRLMKGVFLAKRKLDEELSAGPSIDFVADKYGPFSKDVLQAIDSLDRQGLISIREREDEHSGDKHLLTDEGIRVAKNYWDELSREERELLCWIKRKHIAQPLDRLLGFVYKRYPKMTSESDIRDKYL